MHTKTDTNFGTGKKLLRINTVWAIICAMLAAALIEAVVLLIRGVGAAQNLVVLLLFTIVCSLLVTAYAAISGRGGTYGEEQYPEILERHSIDRLAARYEEPEHLTHLGCFLIKIGNLARINAEKGHEAGDRAIDIFCGILESVAAGYGQLGRNGGNEYLTIIENCDHTVSDLFLMDIEHKVREHNDREPELPIEVTYTYVLNDEAGTTRFFGLIARTYQKYEGSAQQLI